MKKILHRNNHLGYIHSPVVLLLVVVFGLAAIGAAPGDAEALKAEKKHEIGYLGVSLQALTDEVVEGLNLKVQRGVLVNDVFEDSPAEEAGIEEGDVIIEYDGQKVNSAKRFIRLVQESEIGREVELKVVRDGDTKIFAVIIGERPEEFAVEEPKVIFDKKLKAFPELFVDQFKPGARLGVKIQDLEDEDLAAYFHVEEGEGVLVVGVVEESAAEEAGVKAGDVIIRLNGEEIDSSDELIDEVGEMKPGDEFELVVMRHGRKETLTGKVKEGEGWKEFKFSSKCWPHMEDWTRSIHLYKDDLKKAKDKYKKAMKYRLKVDEDDIREQLREIKEELKKLKEEMKERLEELEEE